MKLLIFVCLAVATLASPINEDPEWQEIDWTKVVPITDIPGFWDGRDVRPSEFESSKKEPRIVGGAEAPRNSRPFQAGLIMNVAQGQVFCGGSIISESRILTAGHCSLETYQTLVIVGAHDRTLNEASQQRVTVPSSHYRIHDAYNPQNLNNDISVLILPNSLALNQYVSPISLAEPSQGDFFSQQATMSGWGRVLSSNNNLPTLLRYVTRPVIRNTECALTYSTAILPSTLCVSTTGGQGTCNGDSGGPLTVSTTDGIRLAGVVSFVHIYGCEMGYPAGFARVSSFREWILKQ